MTLPTSDIPRTSDALGSAQADISSVLVEERLFPPPPAFAAAASLKAEDLAELHRRAAADPLGFWAELARAEIAWQRLFTQTIDESAAPNYRWFADGALNVSYNCLDVHLAEHGQPSFPFHQRRGSEQKTKMNVLASRLFRP